jgi:hypothetical protein
LGAGRKALVSEIFEFVSGVGELLASWRFYLCAIPAIAVAVAVGTQLQNQVLAWVIAAPVLLAGIGGGFYWEWRAR